MKILNLLSAGNTGGIEILCKNIILNSKEDNRACFIFGKGEIYDELKNRNEKIFSTKEYKKNILKIINEIVRYCNNEKIDIIIMHHEGFLCDLIYIMLKKRLKKIKFVRYIHCSYDKYYKNCEKNILLKRISKLLIQQTLNKSDLIIFVSNAVKKSFEDNFSIKENNKVIYNGITDEFFKKNLKNKTNNNNIAFVGRLSKVKGIDILIDAVEIVHRKNNNIRLTITGEGEEKENLQEKVKKLGLNNCIKFTGRKNNVIPILDQANIFIYPSIWEEGFGISVIEAMARGCIPITFNKGGLKEIITNKVNGILVNNVSSEELSKKINYLISLDNEKINKMRENAIKRAKDFKINNTINEIEDALKTL